MVRAVRLRIHSCFQARKEFAALHMVTIKSLSYMKKGAFPVIHDKFLEIELPDQRIAVLKASFTHSCIQQISTERC